tara:strand:- start:3000 stop:3581 length:582 start_codon:yes stop_codon:yes gene_type:complete
MAFLGNIFNSGNFGNNQGSGAATSGAGGVLGGIAGAGTGIIPGTVATSIPRPGRPIKPGGFIGGQWWNRPGRPGRPVRPGRPGRPIFDTPSRYTVPYHTHTMEHNGWTKETGGPTNMRMTKPRPPFFGGGFIGRPRPIPQVPIQPRPVTTIKPGMNIPAVPQAPMMRNASGCGAGYSNASGDECGLWMCASGH